MDRFAKIRRKLLSLDSDDEILDYFDKSNDSDWNIKDEISQLNKTCRRLKRKRRKTRVNRRRKSKKSSKNTIKKTILSNSCGCDLIGKFYFCTNKCFGFCIYYYKFPVIFQEKFYDFDDTLLSTNSSNYFLNKLNFAVVRGGKLSYIDVEQSKLPQKQLRLVILFLKFCHLI